MTLIEAGPPVLPEPDWRKLLPRQAEREAAAEHWRVIVTEMEARDILSLTNGHAIMRLVLARVMHDRAAAKAMRGGPVKEPTKGNARAIARPNLYFAAMREAGAMTAQLEADLGLSPRTRSRVGKVPRTHRPSAAGRYLKSVPALPPPTPVVPFPLQPAATKEPAHERRADPRDVRADQEGDPPADPEAG